MAKVNATPPFIYNENVKRRQNFKCIYNLYHSKRFDQFSIKSGRNC